VLDHESTDQPVARQSAARHQPRRGVVGHLIVAALWLTATGCNSIYHRVQKELPPEPGAQLTVRVEEARRAEKVAAQAGSKLRADLARRLPGEAIQADMDRLEMVALDLQRRAAAARDVAASSKGNPELASEVERLDQRSKAWLDFVQVARKSDPAAQGARLDALLHGPAAPATSAPR
jgi:hypothetical protein